MKIFPPTYIVPPSRIRPPIHPVHPSIRPRRTLHRQQPAPYISRIPLSPPRHSHQYVLPRACPPSLSPPANQPAAVSYADVAASGPKQSPQEVSAPRSRDAAAHDGGGGSETARISERGNLTAPPRQAAAPQPPEIVPNESASTASLIDVDIPSVHTVPSDFLEQDITTETQADRVGREAAKAKAKAERAKKEAADKARRADSWLTSQFSKLSDGDASALALANVAAVIGISSWLGYRAWGLYEKGRLDWKTAGVGLGILAGVGAVQSLFGGYLYKGKKGSP